MMIIRSAPLRGSAKIFTTILMLLLVASCGSVGNAEAQAINELKTNRLLAGPPGGGSTDTITFTVNNAIYSPFYGDVHTGTFSGTIGEYENISFYPPVNSTVYGSWLNPILYPAASGTHANFDVLRLEAGIIQAGTATVTNSTTLHIHGTPAGGVNNRAIWVEAGLSEFDGPITATSTITTGGYTVSTLPAGTAGMRAYVTDQLTTCAAIGAALTGGGIVTCPAFYNGTAWVSG